MASASVTRRLTICTDPPGALVYVDDRPIGVTPVSANFLYYGTRQIRLVKDGYQTLTVMQPIATPWYEIPGIDFFSENLTPGELRDHRTFNYRLVPQSVVSTEILRQRGEELRARASASGAVLTTPNGTPYRAPNGRAAPGPPGAEVIPTPAPLVRAPLTNGPVPNGVVAPGVQAVPSTPPYAVPAPGAAAPQVYPQANPPLYPTPQPAAAGQAPLQIAPPNNWTVPLR